MSTDPDRDAINEFVGRVIEAPDPEDCPLHASHGVEADWCDTCFWVAEPRQP